MDGRGAGSAAGGAGDGTRAGAGDGALNPLRAGPVGVDLEGVPGDMAVLEGVVGVILAVIAVPIGEDNCDSAFVGGTQSLGVTGSPGEGDLLTVCDVLIGASVAPVLPSASRLAVGPISNAASESRGMAVPYDEVDEGARAGGRGRVGGWDSSRVGVGGSSRVAERVGSRPGIWNGSRIKVAAAFGSRAWKALDEDWIGLAYSDWPVGPNGVLATVVAGESAVLYELVDTVVRAGLIGVGAGLVDRGTGLVDRGAGLVDKVTEVVDTVAAFEDMVIEGAGLLEAVARAGLLDMTALTDWAVSTESRLFGGLEEIAAGLTGLCLPSGLEGLCLPSDLNGLCLPSGLNPSFAPKLALVVAVVAFLKGPCLFSTFCGLCLPPMLASVAGLLFAGL